MSGELHGGKKDLASCNGNMPSLEEGSWSEKKVPAVPFHVFFLCRINMTDDALKSFHVALFTCALITNKETKNKHLTVIEVQQGMLRVMFFF